MAVSSVGLLQAASRRAVRPDSFNVSYKVIDPKTGKVKYQNWPKFKNKDGEKFQRINFRDME
jgi:hypothetical protein